MKIVRLLLRLFLHGGALWVVVLGSYAILLALNVVPVVPSLRWRARVVLGFIGLIMVEGVNALECRYRQRKKKGSCDG